MNEDNMDKDTATDGRTDTLTIEKVLNDSAAGGVSNTSTDEVEPNIRFNELQTELVSLEKKLSDIHHDERCGNEEVCCNEGGIFTTEFVCYCNYEQRREEVREPFQRLLHQISDFADAHKIYSQEALKIHKQTRDLNRQYIVAQSLGMVEMQLDLLYDLKRYEEGAELAIQHNNFEYAISFLKLLKDLPRLLSYAQEKGLDKVVIETLLKMDDVDGALKHAESKSMHEKSIEILHSKKGFDEAIAYAEKYNLHGEAVEMLATNGCFGKLFEYGTKHNCQSAVRIKSQQILETLLDENNIFGDENNISMKSSKARDLCAVMENHHLQRSVSLYREVIDEFEKRVETKRRIKKSEEQLQVSVNKMLWFYVADLELSLGNIARYKKIWEKTKEIWENKPYDHNNWDKIIDGSMMDRSGYTTLRTNHVSLAQWRIDNPRYHSQHEGLPKWGYSTRLLLDIAIPLAELMEVENEVGEKRYPFLSLDSVINAWGTEGIDTFFKSYIDVFYYDNARIPLGSKRFIAHSERFFAYSYRYSYDVASKFMKKKLIVSLENIHSAEAFTFIVHHFPYLFQTNFGEDKESLITSSLTTSIDTAFNRVGELLEYVLAETSQDEEKSVRKKIALENLLYVPVKQLTQENIFELATGGPDAVWKHIVSSEKGFENKASSELYSEMQIGCSFIEPRLREIQKMYPHFDEATKKRMKQVFFEAYTSFEMTSALNRALTLYVELKQAYGKPMIFPEKHPFYFLHALPSEEVEMQVYAKQVMKELLSVPKNRKQVAEVALGRTLHEFFEIAFGIESTVTKPNFPEKMIEFLAASPEQLDRHLEALKSIKDKPNLFFELESTPAGEHESLPRWASLEHYHQFSSAILAQHSSLFVPEALSKYAIITARPQGKKLGIKERMRREVDAICYLFREMYQIAQSQTFKESTPFRQTAVSIIVSVWKEKQKRFLSSEVAETLAQFNFNRFFHGKDETIQRYLETIKKKQENIDSLFVDQPTILFSKILDTDYYLEMKHGLSDDFINSINRLKNGISTSWTFDELRCEFNESFLHDFFNNAAECTGNGGKYQRYGYAHRQDRNIGIIAANIYESGRHKSTVGKAFLARCRDKEDKEALYVDGVVMLQDIADFLIEPNLQEPSHEAHWMPLYTKAIIKTAQAHHLNEIVFNASHKLAQRSVWQYICHVAELLGLEEGKDFDYKEGRIDDGSSKHSINVKTMSEQGFKLNKTVAQKNVHYLEKVLDESYIGEHLLEGFWINHYDTAQAKEPVSDTYGIVSPQDHKTIPQVNDAKGYVIGFRRSTQELIELFNKKYGGLYGKI